LKRPARGALGLLLAGMLGTASTALAWPPDRLTVTGGPAYDYKPSQDATLLAVAFGHDYPILKSSGLVLAPEVYPLILLHQRDYRDGRKRLNPAIAGALALAYRGRIGGTAMGYRVEAGSGLSWALAHSAPSSGSRFNFYDQFGLHLSLRLENGRTVSLGYRWVHISNLAIFEGRDNPGFGFNTLSLGYEWR